MNAKIRLLKNDSEKVSVICKAELGTKYITYYAYPNTVSHGENYHVKLCRHSIYNSLNSDLIESIRKLSLHIAYKNIDKLDDAIYEVEQEIEKAKNKIDIQYDKKIYENEEELFESIEQKKNT